MMEYVQEEILGSEDSHLVLFLSLPLTSSDTAHQFSCAFSLTGMESNMMLKTVQYWTHWLDYEKCPSFLETEPFSKTQLKFILKANTQSH